MKLIKEQQLDFLSLTEHSTPEREMHALKGHFNKASYGFYGTPGQPTDSTTTTRTHLGAGVIWNTARLHSTHAETIVPGRVVRVDLEIIGAADGTPPLHIYATHMPQRDAADVEEVWDILIKNATSDPHAWIVGDLNAEAAEVLDAAQRAWRRSDHKLQELREHGNVHRTGCGRATHHLGHEIDMILVNDYVHTRISEAQIRAGINGKDHSCVWADYRYHRDEQNRGPSRPKGLPLHKLQLQDYVTYREKAADHVETALARLADDADTHDRLHALQNALTCAAAEQVNAADARARLEREQRRAQRTDAERGNADAAADATPTTNDEAADTPPTTPPAHRPRANARRNRNERVRRTKLDRARWNHARWQSHTFAAQRYHGRLLIGANDQHPLARETHLRRIMRDSSITQQQRGDAVRAYCRQATERAAQELANTQQQNERWQCAIVERVRKIIDGDSRRHLADLTELMREARSGGTTHKNGAKLVEMYDENKQVLRDPQQVRSAAQRAGQRINARRPAHHGATKRLLSWLRTNDHNPHPTTASNNSDNNNEDSITRACSWDNFQRALEHTERDKAVGADGFNIYLIKEAPEPIQRQYWELIINMIKNADFPPEFSEWIAMLAMKSGNEDPRQLERRRDLWITCGAQKLIMRMLSPEYEHAARNYTPSSQAGYTTGRNGPEHTLAFRVLQAKAAREQTPFCVGMIDLGCFFMSVVKDVMFQVEAHTGVPPGITNVIKTLHSNVTGRYETDSGLTEPFDILNGTGQGCVNGAIRGQLLLTVIQRTVSHLCRGASAGQIDESGMGRTTTHKRHTRATARL